MILAEAMRNNIGAMAIIIGCLFAARLIEIPTSLRVLSQLWNLIPINLVKFDQGFLDLRLFSLGGLQLTTWQFAPIVYLLLGVFILISGKLCYCKNRD
jgi:hypothetical protein